MSAGGKDPESARNAEQIDIKRLPPKIQKVLDKYDVDGDGTITAAEFVIAMEQHEATKDSLAKQKKIVFWLLFVVVPAALVFVGVSFGVVYSAIEYAKEAKVDSGSIYTSSTDNQPIGTADVRYQAMSSENIGDTVLHDIKEVTFDIDGMRTFSRVDSVVRLPRDPTVHVDLTKGPLGIVTPDAYLVVKGQELEVEEDSELITKIMKMRGIDSTNSKRRRLLARGGGGNMKIFGRPGQTMGGSPSLLGGDGGNDNCAYERVCPASPSPPPPSPPSPPSPPPSPPNPPPPPESPGTTNIVIDGACTDGKFYLSPDEKYVRLLADVPDVSAFAITYDASSKSDSDVRTFTENVLTELYPVGLEILHQYGVAKGVGRDGGIVKCLEDWRVETSTAAKIAGGLALAIHECGHGVDSAGRDGANNYYLYSYNSTAGASVLPLLLKPDKMAGVDCGTWSKDGYAPARSTLLNDTYNYLRPPCEVVGSNPYGTESKITQSKESGNGPYGCDSTYSMIYLEGDPYDGQCSSGSQGYNMLFEETVQYIHSMATQFYVRKLTGSTGYGSSRHATLMWLWWNQRYIRRLRVDFNDDTNGNLYDKYILGSVVGYENFATEWREAILSVWGRAWLYLATDLPGQQEEVDKLLPLVKDETLLGEIQRIREAHGCNIADRWDASAAQLAGSQ